MSNEQCIHHWVIDNFNVGRCIKPGCGAVRDFGAPMKKRERELVEIRQPAQQHGGKRGRPRKGVKNGPRKS